ncbi:MAG: DUF3135 domain-containing protein [Pseudomonadota bacterium]
MAGLPDFDTLRHLAETQPQALESLYEKEFNAILSRRNTDGQRKLRGLQFKIDAQKEVAKNPVDRMLRIFNMMNESFSDLNDALTAFKAGEVWQRPQTSLTRNPQKRSKIIHLPPKSYQ